MAGVEMGEKAKRLRRKNLYVLRDLCQNQKMDIIELSQKLEGHLLESHSIPSTAVCDSVTHRITRSQTLIAEKPFLSEHNQVKPHQIKLNSNEQETKNIYFNNKAKIAHKNLETIYEDPIWKKGETLLVGTSKVKRSIHLNREFRITSKQKSKLRKSKIKRLGKKFKLMKMSDDEFKSKMIKIDNFLNDNYTYEECSKIKSENCSHNDFITNINKEKECSRSYVDIKSKMKDVDVKEIKIGSSNDLCLNNTKDKYFKKTSFTEVEECNEFENKNVSMNCNSFESCNLFDDFMMVD